MQLNRRIIVESILILAFSIIWCELGHYYFVFFFNCSGWPGLNDATTHSDHNMTKMMIITDTHIMGPIKSMKLDKLRREWQMKQSFRISNNLYKPDVIIFMGDLLDEGSFSSEKDFNKACDEFDRIFYVDNNIQMKIIIPGNHDIGFHDHMKHFPFLIGRFIDRFNTTPLIELVQEPRLMHLNLVVSNSMSFYNDTCPFCDSSKQALNQLGSYMRSREAADPDNFASPIFLGHIPLYRPNDLGCQYSIDLSSRLAEKNVEGHDVLHRNSSEAIAEILRPRLAISGHTHMFCDTKHSSNGGQFQEITVSTYNHKYALLKPGFLLLTANATKINHKYCELIDERDIISIYTMALLVILIRSLITLQNNLNLDGKMGQ